MSTAARFLPRLAAAHKAGAVIHMFRPPIAAAVRQRRAAGPSH
jgi:hypothetical protein